MTTRNARFWVWHADGWVKLTLRPGEELLHVTSGPTEEGWYRESVSWVHMGDGVQMESMSEGRDCDGRYDRGSAVFCPLADLAADTDTEGMPYPPPAGLPKWEQVDAYQRDHTAEAAGY